MCPTFYVVIKNLMAFFFKVPMNNPFIQPMEAPDIVLNIQNSSHVEKPDTAINILEPVCQKVAQAEEKPEPKVSLPTMQKAFNEAQINFTKSKR